MGSYGCQAQGGHERFGIPGIFPERMYKKDFHINQIESSTLCASEAMCLFIEAHSWPALARKTALIRSQPLLLPLASLSARTSPYGYPGKEISFELAASMPRTGDTSISFCSL